MKRTEKYYFDSFLKLLIITFFPTKILLNCTIVIILSAHYIQVNIFDRYLHKPQILQMLLAVMTQNKVV